MYYWIDLLTICVMLMNLVMLSSTRITVCIRILAVQAVVAGIMPLAVGYDAITASTLIFAAASIGLKGIVFPLLLFKAQREANIRKEVEPMGGYPLSLLAGAAMFFISLWISRRLPYSGPLFSDLIVPVSFTTFFTGMFIIVSRTKALTQVIGYVVLENGIYLFGAAFLIEQPFLVELAVLLDIFVAVFVMGIAIFHINREFDHIDTGDLSELKG